MVLGTRELLFTHLRLGSQEYPSQPQLKLSQDLPSHDLYIYQLIRNRAIGM
jgi:hypothetical protein